MVEEEVSNRTEKEGGIWAERINNWREQDKELLQLASDDPLQEELELSSTEQAGKKITRQLEFMRKVSKSVLSVDADESSQYVPSGKVLTRAQELLRSETIRNRLLSMQDTGSGDEEQEPLRAEEISDAIGTMRNAVLQERFTAHMHAAEEQGDTKLALVMGLQALAAKSRRRSE